MQLIGSSHLYKGQIKIERYIVKSMDLRKLKVWKLRERCAADRVDVRLRRAPHLICLPTTLVFPVSSRFFFIFIFFGGRSPGNIDSPYHVQSCAVFHGNALFLQRGPEACGNIDRCCLSVVTNDFREV